MESKTMTNEIDLTLRDVLYEAGIRFSNRPILSHSLRFYCCGHIFDSDEKLCDENIRYFTGYKNIKEYLDEFFDYAFNYEQVTPVMFNKCYRSNAEFKQNAQRNTGNMVRQFIALHELMLCACIEGDLVLFHSQANFNSDIVKHVIKLDVLCNLGVRDIKNDSIE